MKTVYLLKRGEIQMNGQMFFYDDMVFTSKKKAKRYVNNGLEVNKGYNYAETTPWFNEDIYITYDCLCCEGRPMTVRFQLKRVNLI